MTNKGNEPGRAGHGARSRLDDSEELAERKRQRQTTGLVEILGSLPPERGEEIRNIVKNVEATEQRHHPESRVSEITPIPEGLAIETNTEKLAQHIADAIRKSQNAEVDRTFDDEGKRRVLTCRLPGKA